MDAILDDSLKATRTVYRVLVAASAATLVFALSLKAPAAQIALRGALESLLTFPFHDYDDVVDDKIAAFEAAQLEPIKARVAAGLASKAGMMFGVDRISEAMGRAMVQNRFVLDETKLLTPGKATLDELDALGRIYALDKNVDVILPNASDVVQEVGTFLENNGGTGLSVETVRLESDPSETDTVHSTATFQLYFELRASGRQQSAPVFTGQFRAPITTIPETAFQDWLMSREEARPFVASTETGLRWLPEFRDNPEAIRGGDQSKPMKELLDSTAAEIDKHGPAKQVVSFLGTNVPGQLVAFASPIVLLLLGYSLQNHIVHLNKLRREVGADLGRFAWMPVSLPPFHGKVEFLFSAIILPVSTLAMLQVKLGWVGDLRMIRLVCIASGAIGVLGIGIRSLRLLSALRGPESPSP